MQGSHRSLTRTGVTSVNCERVVNVVGPLPQRLSLCASSILLTQHAALAVLTNPSIWCVVLDVGDPGEVVTPFSSASLSIKRHTLMCLPVRGHASHSRHHRQPSVHRSPSLSTAMKRTKKSNKKRTVRKEPFTSKKGKSSIVIFEDTKLTQMSRKCSMALARYASSAMNSPKSGIRTRSSQRCISSSTSHRSSRKVEGKRVDHRRHLS